MPDETGDPCDGHDQESRLMDSKGKIIEKKCYRCSKGKLIPKPCWWDNLCIAVYSIALIMIVLMLVVLYFKGIHNIDKLLLTGSV